jgi:hypothetical protein
MTKWLQEHAAIIGIVLIIAYEIRQQRKRKR